MSNEIDTVKGETIDRRSFLSAASTAGVLGLTGYTGRQDDGEMVFGEPAILSGGISFIQPPVSASVDIAEGMINDAGGPLDRQINVIRRDTAYQPPKARQILRQFVNADNAVVLNGLTSTTLVPNWDFLQELQVPVVTMYAGTRFLDTRGGDKNTSEDLSDDGWVWRTTGADSQHTAAAALHAKEAGATNIGVINTKTAGARTWAEAFYDAVGVIDGLSQTRQMEVEGGKTTYRSDLAQFFQGDIDLFGIAVEEAPDAVTMLEEWKEGPYGETRVMLSNPMKNSKVREELGELLQEDWVRVSVPAIAGPWSDNYLDRFRSFVQESDDYEDDLTVNNWSASAYDSITVSALAIQAAGEASHDAIEQNIGPVTRPPGTEVSTFAEGKEALQNGEQINYQGAQTAVDFNEFGDVFNTAQIWELAPEWQEVTQIDAEQIQEVVAGVREQG